MTIGGVSRVTSSYDALGRLDGHLERDGAGAMVFERYGLGYSSRGQLLRPTAPSPRQRPSVRRTR